MLGRRCMLVSHQGVFPGLVSHLRMMDLRVSHGRQSILSLRLQSAQLPLIELLLVLDHRVDVDILLITPRPLRASPMRHLARWSLLAETSLLVQLGQVGNESLLRVSGLFHAAGDAHGGLGPRPVDYLDRVLVTVRHVTRPKLALAQLLVPILRAFLVVLVVLVLGQTRELVYLLINFSPNLLV